MDRPPNRDKTKRAIQEAISEVQHATRPRARSARDVFSWFVALAAGAAVAWRGIHKAAEAGEERRAAAGVEAETQRLSRQFEAAREEEVAAPAPASTSNGDGRTARREAEPGVTRPGESAASPPGETVRVAGTWMGLAKEFYARFMEDECLTRAEALAFTVILSLAPLMLLALAALGFLIRDPQQAADYVHRFIAQMLPGQQAEKAVDQVLAQTHIIESAQTLMQGRWWAIVVGVLSLLWAALSLLVNATTPMNAAWDVQETRSFLRLRLICLGVFAGAGLFFALSLLPSSAPDMIQRLHIPWLGLPKHPPFLIATLLQILFEALAWCLDIAMFVIIYRFLPGANVTWKTALFGGALTGLLWEVFKKGFAVYLANFGDFNKLYGALGGVILLLTWILYTCLILLAGAILCKMYYEHREEGGVVCRKRRPHEPASDFRTAGEKRR
jgi:membrane protein